MSVLASLKEGNLARAKAELQDQVRRAPADPKPRGALFELLCVLGEWERAVNQLEVLGGMDATLLPFVQVYGSAVSSEPFRAEVFAGRRAPLILGEPDPWIAGLTEAARMTAEGHHAEARALRERSLEDATAVPGSVDGRPFQWIGDADTRLGPVLEAIVNGKYYWLPFQRVRRLRLEKPESLVDLVWARAQVVFANAGEAPALVPVRYAGSESSTDDRIRLARATEWRDLGHETFAGIGQRLLATDDADHALLDVREILLEAPAGAGGAERAEGA